MRPPAQVDEPVVAVNRDDLTATHFPRIDGLDDLPLEGLPGEHVECRVAAQLLAQEWLVLGDDLAHPAIDLGEVVGCEGPPDVEVVIEPVLDRRADGEMGTLVEVEHRLGEHMGGRMADHLPPIVAARHHHLEGPSTRQGAVQVEQPAIEPRRHRGTGEPCADPGGDVVAGCAVGMLLP